jgi:hypothetical protein
MTPIRQRMIEELQLRNYSASTVHSYVTGVWRFTRHYHTSPELCATTRNEPSIRFR